MGNDIVARLRSDFPKKQDCREGADEIERLRNLLTEAQVSFKKSFKTVPTIIEGTRHYQLLSAFAENTNLTTDEAGVYLDIPEGEYGWWSKVSDLKRAGYIEETDLKRKSRKGVNVEVCKITPKGKEVLLSAGYCG